MVQIKRDGITKLVVLPLYPQSSISTTGLRSAPFRIFSSNFFSFQFVLLHIMECHILKLKCMDILPVSNHQYLTLCTLRDDSYLSRLPVAIIESWYQRQGYIKSMANLIEEELHNFTKPEEVACLIPLFVWP